MAGYYRPATGTRAESSSPYDARASHPNVEHEGDSSRDSTSGHASTWSSQNEDLLRNPTSIENWSSDAVVRGQTWARPVVRRKPVPNPGSGPETEGVFRSRRTESTSSGGSISENSRAEVGGRKPEYSNSPRPSASEAKHIYGDRSMIFEATKNSTESVVKQQDGNTAKLIILLGIVVVVLALVWSISLSRTEQVVRLTLSSPVIAIMGETGAGKSSFIKALGGRDDHGNWPVVGNTLNSTTKEVAWYSAAVGSKGVYIIDTPGFDDSFMSDFEILQGLTKELVTIYNDAKPLTGIIYVHDVSKEKMGGTSHKSLRTFQKLVGDQSMQNVVLATTHWRMFFNGDQVKREEELRKTFWASMIARGSKIVRHNGSRKSALRIVKEMLDRKPVVIKIVDEMVNKKMTFDKTDAGGVVKDGLKVLEVKLDSNIAALNDEIAQLKKDKKDAASGKEDRVKQLEAKWRTSSEKERQDIKSEIERVKSESKEQATNLNKQLTSVMYEKQRLSYQINDLKKTNEALRDRLDRQNREMRKNINIDRNSKALDSKSKPGEKTSGKVWIDILKIIIKIMVCIILPPVAVYLERGPTSDVWINLGYTLLGYIPGILHALRIVFG